MQPNHQDKAPARSDDDPKLKYLARRAPYEDPPPAAPGCGFWFALLCLNLFIMGFPVLLTALEIRGGGDGSLLLLLLNPNPWAAAWFVKRKFPAHGTALAVVTFLIVAPLSVWLLSMIWVFLFFTFVGLPIM